MNEKTKKTSKPFIWLRDLMVFGIILGAIMWWQERHLIQADGTQVINNTAFVSVNGEVQRLLAEDKPTLVYFFAPWCQVCYWSVNNIDGLNSDKVRVIKVALSYQNKEEVMAFIERTGTQPNVVFGNDATLAQFNVTAFPTVYIVDANGTVIGNSVGYTTEIGTKLRLAFL